MQAQSSVHDISEACTDLPGGGKGKLEADVIMPTKVAVWSPLAWWLSLIVVLYVAAKRLVLKSVLILNLLVLVSQLVVKASN